MTDQGQTEFLRKAIPFAAMLAVEVITNAPEEVRARLAWQEDRCTTGGVLHGGVIMALADTTGAGCAFLNLPEGAAGTTTIESKTNFMAAGRGGIIRAECTPLHRGKRTMVWQTRVTDESGRLLSLTIQTQMVLT